MALIECDEIRYKMAKYGFHAPDMTINEFVKDELTPAEAIPIIYGEWIPTMHANGYTHRCSVCGERGYDTMKHCPECGSVNRKEQV